jgi:hypothetical protein
MVSVSQDKLDLPDFETRHPLRRFAPVWVERSSISSLIDELASSLVALRR